VPFARVLDNYGLLERIRRVRKRPVGAYGIAVAAVAVATLLRLPVTGPLSGAAPFTTYSLAIIVVAVVCGFWPSLLTVLLSVLGGWFLFLPPSFSFALESAQQVWTLAMFALVASVNAMLVSALVGNLLLRDEHQQFLIRELHHRSQNLFSVIQAIASRSLVEGQTISEAKDLLTGRLAALARTHAMLANREWAGEPLDQIVTQELEPFAKQVTFSGCDIVINTPAAQSFALIVHELATNAAKHGALSAPEGRVLIECKREGANGKGEFRLVWTETGGPRLRCQREKNSGAQSYSTRRSGLAITWKRNISPKDSLMRLAFH
jgi:two-component sensor histidine kinase